jgi:hypothetical protein
MKRGIDFHLYTLEDRILVEMKCRGTETLVKRKNNFHNDLAAISPPNGKDNSSFLPRPMKLRITSNYVERFTLSER